MDRYSARISPSARIADDVGYEALLDRICEYTLQAAFARAVDQHDWEQDQLRCRGLLAIELFRNARAVWHDRASFEDALADETRLGKHAQFEEANELDVELWGRIDTDLRERWRVAGYMVRELRHDMKGLFAELEADAKDCAREARDVLMAEILSAANGRKNPQLNGR